MNKIKNFMNKPITWGGYFKMCGVCMGLSMLTYAGLYAYLKYDENKYSCDRDEFLKNLHHLDLQTEESESE